MAAESKVDEFISLLTTHQRSIFCYVLARVVSASDADDVTQEVCTEMWKKFNQYQPGTNFLAWGMQIAYFKIQEHRNKVKSLRSQLSDETVELLDADQRRLEKASDHQIEQLRSCVNQLPKSLRSLIRARYTDGLSPKIIADQSNRNLHSIYRMLSKAHELLLGCMKRAAGITSL